MNLHAESFSTELAKSIKWHIICPSVLAEINYYFIISEDSQRKLWLLMLMCAFISSPEILNRQVIFFGFLYYNLYPLLLSSPYFILTII